jgi:hypothetical protein
MMETETPPKPVFWEVGNPTTHQIIINRKEKPNSYEVGKAGNRFTIFFDTPEDLKAQLDKLKDLGFLKEDGV